jgi:NAD(P)H-hydrate epimerase
VASPDGLLSVNPTGNALLATAGTGDVLSGVIAAFLAGGAAPLDAARAGVYIHGLAADLATATYGDRGMLAGDLLDLLPRAIHRVLHDPHGAQLP